MVINSYIKQYENEIKAAVFSYSYENYNVEPLLDMRTAPWFGDIFDVANIDTELSLDLIEDLKLRGMYYDIKENCTRYVILPDAFSAHPTPLNLTRNEYDIDARNVVIVNGQVFEIFINQREYYVYNHNGRT